MLEQHIDYSRDSLLTQFGKETLKDRYLKPNEKSPQDAFMRTSVAFASNEAHALRMYDYASKQWIGYASPVLSNAPVRTKFFQEYSKNFSKDAYESVLGALPISCFTGFVGDSREEIGFHYLESLWLASGGGGYKAYWGDLRPVNSTTSTGSKTGGLIPFFHVMDGMIVATHQGNNRRGVYGGCIRDNHPEIIEFIESRKMSGDPNKRSRNIFQTVNISDAFMYAVLENAQWALIDHEGNTVKTVSARSLWELMLESPFELGCPFLHWIDSSNDMLPSVQKALGLRVNNVNICCMSADQRVVTDLGLVTVAELYASQYAPKLAGRGVISQGTPMLLPRPNAPMVKVITSEGYSHKVTPDHRIWVVGKGWVEAQDIQPNDKIELQTQSLFGIESNEALAFIAGLIAGDGTYSHDSANVRIDLWKGKTDHLVSEVEQLVHSVLANQAINTNVPVPATNTPMFKDCGDKYSLNSRQLAALLTEHGFTCDTKLKVPEFVFKGTKETIEQYIRGLFLTDGTVQATNKGAATVSLASVNKPLLEDVQLLLINLGITSRIKLARESSVKNMPNGKGGLSPYQCADLYRLLITSTQMSKAINSFTSIGESRSNQEFLALISKETFRVKPKYQATFVGLEVLPNEDAYCLTVDSEDHAWTVQGMITHNTEITLANDKFRTAVCCLSSLNHLKRDEWFGNDLFIRDCVEFLDNVLEYFIQNAIYACTKDYNWDGLKNIIRTDLVDALNPADPLESVSAKDKPTLRESLDKIYQDIGLDVESVVEKMAKNIVEKAIMGYKKAVYSAKSERAIGLGMMGLDSYFMDKEIPYESQEAVNITYNSFKWVKESAVKASIDLGTERGEAPDMVGTGRRNSHLLAVAPTATNSTIAGGITPALEKRFKNIFPQKTKSGTFEVVEPALIRALNRHGLNTPETIKFIKDNKGSVQNVDGLTELEKLYLRTAFETDQMWVVEHAAAAQEFVCQAVSTNLFIRPGTPRRYVNAVHFRMWQRGLKSRYYIRTEALNDGDAFADEAKEVNTIDYNRANIFEECLACGG